MAIFPKLEQNWSYQSYCSAPGDASNPPQIAAPWARSGKMTVVSDPETGKVTGNLAFPNGIKLAVTGAVIPATAFLPDGIELTAEGLDSISTLRGYFIQGATLVIAGIVVAVRNDLAKQPVGTKGSFVMLPSAG